MRQALPGGHFLDLLTKDELKEAMGHQVDAYTRDRYRGMKLIRLPIVRVTASGATFTIGGNAQADNPGPQSGYIWRLSRLMVASSSLADTAKYIVYAGSDPTATDAAHLLDAINGGATPGQNVNVAFRPGNKAEWVFADEFPYCAVTGATTSNQYTMTGIAVEVPAEMVGKIL